MKDDLPTERQLNDLLDVVQNAALWHGILDCFMWKCMDLKKLATIHNLTAA